MPKNASPTARLKVHGAHNSRAGNHTSGDSYTFLISISPRGLCGYQYTSSMKRKTAKVDDLLKDNLQIVMYAVFRPLKELVESKCRASQTAKEITLRKGEETRTMQSIEILAALVRRINPICVVEPHIRLVDLDEIIVPVKLYNALSQLISIIEDLQATENEKREKEVQSSGSTGTQLGFYQRKGSSGLPSTGWGSSKK